MKNIIFNAVSGEKNFRILSIIGTAKNTGKTVTLNYLIREARERQIPLGLTSTGRDGEEWDALYSHFKKPAVFIKKNTLFTTTENILKVGTIKATAVEKTRFRTSLGNVLILKAEEDGNVEIAGPQTNSGIREVAKHMLNAGAELILVDGAVNRKSAASTSVADGIVLCTGAAFDGNMLKVISHAAGFAEIFNLSVLKDESLIGFAEKALEDRKITVVNAYGAYPIASSLTDNGILSDNIKADIYGNENYVIFPGALMTETINKIISVVSEDAGLIFVVKEAANLFIEPEYLFELRKKGADIMVLSPSKLTAVTINPISPVTQAFPKDIFLKKMREALPFTPVMDVLSLSG